MPIQSYTNAALIWIKTTLKPSSSQMFCFRTLCLQKKHKQAIKEIVTNSSKKISFLRLIFMNFFSFSFQSSRLSSLSIWSRHKLEVGKETWDRELLEAQS